MCEKEMVVPLNSARKYCADCRIIRDREKAIKHYKTEKAQPARKRAALKYRQKYQTDPVYRLHTRARNRANEEGLEFNIELSDIVMPEVCPVFGTKFEFGTYYTASPDRIDNSKGYVKGNIQVISWKANAMKNSASAEELIKFADWVYRNYKKEEAANEAA